MRCLKSVDTKRRDEFNRLFLKSCFVWLISFCVLFLSHNLILPGQFSTRYNLLAIILLVVIYPIHKVLHIFAVWKYRSNIDIRIKTHFIIMPCLYVHINRIVPRKRYIFSLAFPFFFILICLIIMAFFLPIWNTPIFIILLAVHIALSYTDFILINQLRQMPKNSFIEDAKLGVSVLTAD